MECVFFFCVCVCVFFGCVIHALWIFEEPQSNNQSFLQPGKTLGFDGALSDDRFWRWPGDRR